MDEDRKDPNTERRGSIQEIRAGQPLQVSGRFDPSAALGVSPLCKAVALTLKEYLKAAREFLKTQDASIRDLAPPHLRKPCHAYVICCPDGILIRYDDAGEEEPKVRFADFSESLSSATPKFSDYVLHIPDSADYVVEANGPYIVMGPVNDRGEILSDGSRCHPVIVARDAFSAIVAPPPPGRPPCISIHCEMQIQIEGRIQPAVTPPKAVAGTVDHFVARGVVLLPVGWQAIEVYPLVDETHWRPEYAAAWAQLDILNMIVQRNAVDSKYQQLDGRRLAREVYQALLDEFESLLTGPEEPCHQFLKAHPELLDPTHNVFWSKLKFGSYVSDFVFRELVDDYLLVEIEAPLRDLFRTNGHPRQELQHAIDQIRDWRGFIRDNRAQIENEMGLKGIAATARALVVIGRSAALSPANRRALSLLQSEQPRLTVLTYDDVIDRARTIVERYLGPMTMRTENLEVYFHRDESERVE